MLFFTSYNRLTSFCLSFFIYGVLNNHVQLSYASAKDKENVRYRKMIFFYLQFVSLCFFPSNNSVALILYFQKAIIILRKLNQLIDRFGLIQKTQMSCYRYCFF